MTACWSSPEESLLSKRASLLLECTTPQGEAVARARGVAQGREVWADAQGQLLFPELKAGRVLVEVQAPGFHSAAYLFELAGGVRAGAAVRLVPLGEPLSFTAGQAVTLRQEGLRVSLPAGPWQGEDGQPVRGQVQAFLTRHDPDTAGPGRISTGPRVGLVGPDKEPVGLEDFVSVDAQLQEDFRIVPFARRGNVEIDLSESIQANPRLGPVRSELFERLRALKRVPAWQFDAEQGALRPVVYGLIRESPERPDHLVWQASDVDLSSSLTIALPFFWRSASWSPEAPLQVPDATPWAETACLAVRVENKRGKPIAGRLVMAEGVDYLGVSQAVTDARGLALLEVMRDREVRLEAGAEALSLHTGAEAGDCRGEGAEPVPVTWVVPAVQCTPGDTATCPVQGTTPFPIAGHHCQQRLQLCDALGRWGECLPLPLPPERCANGVDDDCDGRIDEGCAPLCIKDEQRYCYEGRQGTEDAGLCQSGVQVCQAEGMEWSSCQGQVLPTRERCDTLEEDEDCDGQRNEGCLCQPGTLQGCYAGPLGTQGVGACRGGTQECFVKPGGLSSWGECHNEVAPAPERCDGTDWSCDGEAGCTGAWDWSRISQREILNPGYQRVSALAVDARGNLFIAGTFEGDFALGTAHLSSPGRTSTFLISLEPLGTVRWSRVFEGGSPAQVRALATDPQGRIILVGSFQGTLDLGDGPLSSSAVESDGFVAAFSEEGAPLWSTHFQASGALVPSAVAVNAAGDVFVTGTFSGYFPCAPITCGTQAQDTFVRAYSRWGNALWTWHRGTSSIGPFSPLITPGSEGHPVLLGSFEPYLDFGGSCGVPPLPPGFTPGFSLVRFSSSGECLQLERHELSHYFGTEFTGLAVDPSGSTVVAGNCACEIPPGTELNAPAYDSFLQRFDARGNLSREYTFDGPGNQRLAGLAVDPNGFVLLAGTFEGTLNFRGSLLSAGAAPALFAAKLDGSLEGLVWGKAFRGTPELLRGPAVGPLGHVALAGSASTSLDLQGAPATPAGDPGAFVLRLKP